MEIRPTYLSRGPNVEAKAENDRYIEGYLLFEEHCDYANGLNYDLSLLYHKINGLLQHKACFAVNAVTIINRPIIY